MDAWKDGHSIYDGRTRKKQQLKVHVSLVNAALELLAKHGVYLVYKFRPRIQRGYLGCV